MALHIDGAWFKDELGRVRHLRGVNLGGTSKIPMTPNGATHLKAHFFDHRHVSFVGRPFPLEEADVHFRRLKAWGLSFLRFLVTWEAVEHDGPGQYDQAYLEYVRAVLKKADDYGFTTFIDPHQDVWSRFTGGDGAPGWTLEAVGFDMHNFQATAAAIVHQTQGDPFPRMVWPSNYNKLAAATMFTLFFGGDDFAPETHIDGVPVQAYLQGHFTRAMQQVAEVTKDIPSVIGFGTINEPSRGYIGAKHIAELPHRLKIGECPTPYQSILLGAGFAQDVEVWNITVAGARKQGEKRIDPAGKTAWREGAACVWKQNGLWETDRDGQPHIMMPNHFANRRGRPVHFMDDYLLPFAHRYADAIQSIRPDAMIFFEGDALEESGTLTRVSHDPVTISNMVFAPHWYDGLTLFTKRYQPYFAFHNRTLRPVIGREAVRQSFREQIGTIKGEADIFGKMPVVIGEIGIPYDMNHKSAYQTGDYAAQIQAMEATIGALEANLVNFTLWNYTADNSHVRGDQWNGEDLSIYSLDDRHHPTDLNSGGRALEAVVRPYAAAIPGEPLRMQFDSESGLFELAFRHDASITAPAVLFVPSYQYPDGCEVTVSDGTFDLDQDKQRLIYHPSDKDIPHWLRIAPSVPRRTASTTDRRWQVALFGVGVAAGLWLLGRKRR